MHTLPHPSTCRRAIAFGGFAVLVAIAAACGDTSSTKAGASPSTSVAPVTTTAHANHVEVTAVDFAYQGLPATVTAGTRLTLRNAAPGELHELVAFRLPDSETRSVADLLKLPQSELEPMLAQPSTVLLAAPGEDQIPAVGDGTLTEPGRYLVMCAIPTGVSPAAYLQAAAASGGRKPDVEGGPPHFVSGMFAELNVI